MTICDSCEWEKMAFFPEEAAGADLVISWSADCRLTADGVLVHLNVKDSQVTLRGICVNGGKIVCPKIEIEVDGFGVFFTMGCNKSGGEWV